MELLHIGGLDKVHFFDDGEAAPTSRREELVFGILRRLAQVPARKMIRKVEFWSISSACLRG